MFMWLMCYISVPMFHGSISLLIFFAVTLPGNAFIFVHLDHHVLWQVNELRSMATGALDAVAHDIPSHDLYQEIHLTVIGGHLGSLISLKFCLEFKYPRYDNYDKCPLATGMSGPSTFKLKCQKSNSMKLGVRRCWCHFTTCTTSTWISTLSTLSTLAAAQASLLSMRSIAVPVLALEVGWHNGTSRDLFIWNNIRHVTMTNDGHINWT